MSRVRSIRIDVYGRFIVDVIRKQGRWSVFRVSGDGKRSVLHDLPLTDDADTDDVVSAVEAAFHELATADTDLEVLDIRMG